MTIKKILVITSGGDSPGMNAAIRAITCSGIHYGLKIYGAHRGYQGIVEKDIIPLDIKSVMNCIQRGGTILQTARYPAFHEPAVRQQAAQVLQEYGINNLVVLGGDGSFKGASLLGKEYHIRVIGIPCTIDNDIRGTEYTIGFDTASNTALQAIDRIRDTASSHSRNFLVEVMGRTSGFLAMNVGIAAGAEFILIPEIVISQEELANRLQKRRSHTLGSIIVVAEAGMPGWSLTLSKDLHRLLGVEYKVCILGHTQRGGAPTVEDRKIASLMGAHAVKMLLAGQSQKMIALQKGQLIEVEFPDTQLGARQFSDKEFISLNHILYEI